MWNQHVNLVECYINASPSMPLRSAAGVFSAAGNRLKEIDTLVGEIQMDFRCLHKPNGELHGEEIEDDDYVVDAEYLEIMTLAEQIRSDVRHLQTALDRKRIYDSSYGDEDRSMEENQEQARWPPSASQLELVIQSLDAQLKHCLLCLAMFPADELIKKKMLIHYWIGEGIVQSVTAGKDCFTDLLSRGLLQPACQRQHCSRVHYCKIHPMVSKFLVKMAHRMGFYQFDSEGKPMEDFFPGRSRRACLRKRQIGGRGDDVNEIYGPSNCDEKLLTLYNFNRQYVNMDKMWLSGQGKMSTLQLGQWKPSWRHHIEIVSPKTLEAATECESLKYLSLRGISLIEYIPESIGNLQNLVVMDLRACHNLEKLSDSIGSLRKLEFLDVSECYLLDEMPRGIGNLEELQVLKGFLVGGATSKSNPCRLADLASLPKLRKLSISTGRRALVVQGDELNKLQGCTSLESLTITWGAAAAQEPPCQPIPGVEGSIKGASTRSELLLPARLEKLDLRRTPMENLLHLLHPGKAENLKKLYIRGGKLRSFGDLEGWNVETLRLRFLKDLECDWEQFRASFGKLHFLEMRECPNLTSWKCNGEGLWRMEYDDNGTTHVSCLNK